MTSSNIWDSGFITYDPLSELEPQSFRTLWPFSVGESRILGTSPFGPTSCAHPEQSFKLLIPTPDKQCVDCARVCWGSVCRMKGG